eukprot:1415972-Amphidinium_carterae.2
MVAKYPCSFGMKYGPQRLINLLANAKNHDSECVREHRSYRSAKLHYLLSCGAEVLLKKGLEQNI